MHRSRHRPPSPHPVVPRPRPRTLLLPGRLLGILGIFLLATLPGALPLAAQEPPGDRPAVSDRPTVGLALSGGGARGVAHLGVIEALEELRVPIDYIAGTSMGAVVGGLYASGYSTEEIQAIIEGIDWRDAFRDEPNRTDLAFRLKQEESRYSFGLELGIGSRGLLLPRGVITGQKLNTLFESLSLRTGEVEDFHQLPIPFTAVAADIASGELVRLDSGDLARALRASMAVPGAFSPVQIGDQVLVDGGVLENLPIETVRAMGADVVIAVDVSTLVEPLENPSGDIVQVTQRAFEMLTEQNVKLQKATLGPRDVLIEPDLGDATTMEFERALDFVRPARWATLQRHEDLAPLALAPQEEYRPHGGRSVRVPLPERVAFVEVVGTDQVDPRLVRAQLRLGAGDPFDLEALQEDVQRIYGLGHFERVTFSLVRRGEDTGVILRLQEKSWGPDYLRFSLSFVDDFQGEPSLSTLVSYKQTLINARGGEWLTDLSLGEVLGVSSELYQPLDFDGRFFVAPSLTVERDLQDIFANDFSDAGAVAEYAVRRRTLGLDLGWRLGTWGEARVGLRRGVVEADVRTGDADLPTISAQRGSLVARLALDRLDRPYFATSGYRLDLQAEASLESLGADDPFETLRLDGAWFTTSPGGRTVFFGGEAGTDFDGGLPPYAEFLLGGPFSLSGFARDQVRARTFVLGRAGSYWRVASLPTTVGSGVFVGATVEAAALDVESFVLEDDSSLSTLDLSERLWTGSVFVGAQTLLGPAVLYYGISDTGADRFYLSIGATF